MYGEETELSRKLFEGIPEDLDVGCTEIVSMPNKILMMVRDRGHALTIDMDTTKENDIGVKYFVPKLCNRGMIEALPGVNASAISDNGATGFFVTSKDEMTSKVLDFIGKVPTDNDIQNNYFTYTTIEMDENEVETSDEDRVEETEPIFGEEDAQELAMEKSEKGRTIGIIRYLQNALAKARDNLKNIFKGEKNDDRTNGD